MPTGVYTHKKLSEETKLKISFILRGRKMSKEVCEKLSIIRKGRTSGMLGKKHSEETKEKMRKSHNISIEGLKNIGKSLKGKHWSEKRINSQSKKFKNKYGNYCSEWREIRKEIYKRDNWTCQECNIKCVGKDGKSNKKIQCHHIDWNKDNNNHDNLITLCSVCHGKTNLKKENWIEYFKLKMTERLI